MSDIVDLLEHELEEAFEVKDRKSMHRYVVLMVDRFAFRASQEQAHERIHSEIRDLTAEMKAGFERMDARFAANDRRFEAMDQRFEAMDQRFEDMNQRFEARFAAIDKRFEEMHQSFEARFAAVDKRFEAVDKRFEDVNRRFEDMNKRFNTLVALHSVTFTILAALITVFGVWG